MIPSIWSKGLAAGSVTTTGDRRTPCIVVYIVKIMYRAGREQDKKKPSRCGGLPTNHLGFVNVNRYILPLYTEHFSSIRT